MTRGAARPLLGIAAFLVAMAAVLQRVPWLLLGLYAGAIADRMLARVLGALEGIGLIGLAVGSVLAPLLVLVGDADDWTPARPCHVGKPRRPQPPSKSRPERLYRGCRETDYGDKRRVA